MVTTLPATTLRTPGMVTQFVRPFAISLSTSAHPAPSLPCLGPPSSVQLTTTYLDERVRLGKGSRGSLFVFTRGGQADMAGERRGWGGQVECRRGQAVVFFLTLPLLMIFLLPPLLTPHPN